MLEDIGAAEVPSLRVYNKVDRALPDFVREFDGAEITKHCVSAITGEGLAALKDAVAGAGCRCARCAASCAFGRSRVACGRGCSIGTRCVRETVEDDGGYTLAVDLPAQRWRQLREEEGLSADSIRQKV